MNAANAAPKSFWIISSLALIWHLMGVANFAMQMTTTDTSGFPEWWRLVVESRPAWATIAMAVAVILGALGCVMLLMRRKLATALFTIALVGVVATLAHAVSVGTPGPQEMIMAVVMPVVLGGVMIWYAKLATRKGWIT